MGYGSKYLSYVRKKYVTEVSKGDIVVKKCVIGVGNSALREEINVETVWPTLIHGTFGSPSLNRLEWACVWL